MKLPKCCMTCKHWGEPPFEEHCYECDHFCYWEQDDTNDVRKEEEP